MDRVFFDNKRKEGGLVMITLFSATYALSVQAVLMDWTNLNKDEFGMIIVTRIENLWNKS